MSLLHLVHKNVAIKFADAAKPQFTSEAFYAFRLTGVDAMGFLQIQDLKPDGDHEVSSVPYWINKDLIREIHELDFSKTKEIQFTGIAPVKPSKAKIPKQKAAVKE